MPRTVLLVDEDATVRGALEGALTASSYRVLTAADAETAYALVAAQPVDALLLDVGLPTMSGFGLYLAIVHRWPQLEDRVAIMTRDAGAAIVPWLERHQCTTFTKPVHLQQITAWLDVVLAAQDERSVG